MRILGIDPGSRVTGYGMIDIKGTQSIYVACGCIRAKDDSLVGRLTTIFRGVQEIISQFQPGELAIEKVFIHRNADSALKLGQARGAALCAAGNLNLPVHEYTPNAIKQAVVGKGHAAKQQVQHMIRVLLHLSQEPSTDAADALAAALCHASHRQAPRQVQGYGKRKNKRLKTV